MQQDRTSGRLLKIALTGGIACGKTGISDHFRALGAPVIDADIIARQAVAVGSPALALIAKRFGVKVIDKDGGLNRPLMRRMVFEDPSGQNLEALNAIMHPAIVSLLQKAVDKVTYPYVLLVVPLLFEHRLEYLADRILVIDTDIDTQLARLTLRDGISRELARKMIASQVSGEYRRGRADDLIRSSDKISLDAMRDVVVKLHEKYLRLAANTKEQYPNHVEL